MPRRCSSIWASARNCRALAEVHRVLVPVGLLRIFVPDFEILCGMFVDPVTPREQNCQSVQVMMLFNPLGMHELPKNILQAAAITGERPRA